MKKLGIALLLLSLTAINFGCTKPAAEPAGDPVPEVEAPATEGDAGAEEAGAATDSE